MDGIFRLFCGCCGMQPAEQEPPYSQLRSDSVTPVRDPPIQSQNGHHAPPPLPPHSEQQGFNNPVHDMSFDPNVAHPYAHPPRHEFTEESASPHSEDDFEEEVEDEKQEKEMLENIVENTQQSIIAVGQTDVDGMIVQDVKYRESLYLAKTQKMKSVNPAVKSADSFYDFDFEPTQTPIQVPLRYDEMSSTIEPSPIDRIPFSHPDFNQVKLARPMGHQNPQFLVEHPDLKRVGKAPSISSAVRAKISEVLDEVHQGVTGIEVEPRDLIVSMDF